MWLKYHKNIKTGFYKIRPADEDYYLLSPTLQYFLAAIPTKVWIIDTLYGN